VTSRPANEPIANPNPVEQRQVNSPRRDRGSWVLLALAMFIGGLVVVQMSRLAGGTPAYADLVATAGEHTLLTVEAGNSEDVLVVLDHRAEALLLYRCLNQRSIEFKGRTDLRQLFFDARKLGK